MADTKTKQEHILDIKVSYQDAVTGIIKYEQEIENLKEKMTSLTKGEKDMSKLDEQTRYQVELTRAAIREYNKDIRALRKEIDNNQRIEKENLNSLKSKRAELSNLVKKYDELSEAERQNEEIGGKLAAQIKQMTQEIKGAEAETERFYRNVGNYQQSIVAALTGNNQFAQSIMGLSAGGEGFKGVMSGMMSSIKGFGSALMGLMGNPVFIAIAGIAGAGAAFKWFYDYNKGLAEATKLTKQFTDLSGNELKTYRNQVQAISDTFNVDFKDTLMAANAISKQFGIDTQAALQMVQDGFVAGGDANGEFLDSLKEYPAYFKEAGISADQFVAIVAETGKQGVFSDKGIDAIKEANLRLREMTTSTASALDGIGISSAKVQEELRNGTTTTFEVMQKVSQKLKEYPAQSAEVGAAIADIFGGPGEDAGLQYLQTLGDISTNLDETKEKAGELGALQEEQLNSELELQNALASLFDITGGNFEKMETSVKVFINQSLTSLIKGVVNLINRFIDLYNNSLLVRGIIQAIIAAFRNMYAVVKGAFNLIIDGAKGVGRNLEGILYILEGIFTFSLDKAKQGWELMTSSLGKTIKEGRNDLRNMGREMAQNVVDGYNNTVNNAPLAHLSADGATAGVSGGGVRGTNNVGGGGGGNTPSGNKSSSTGAAKAVADRAKAERDEIAKAESLLTKLIKDNLERRRKEINDSYDKQIADIKAKLAEEGKYTVAAREAMNSQIDSLEKLRERELAKLNEESIKAEIDYENKRISLKLEAIAKGSQEEMNLKLQQLTNEQRLEEASITASITDEQKREDMLIAMRESYAAKRLQIEQDHQKAVREEQEKAISNEWQEKVNAAFGNELLLAQIQAQRSLEQLQNAQQMEGETIEDFNARKLQYEAQYLQDKQALTNKEIEVEQAKYSAISSMVGGLQQVSEAFGEKSKGLAKASKILALAEIAINTGAALAAGIKQAQSVPYPANLTAIATTVATILANVASAIKTVKGAKFSHGGGVRGAGSSTSDSIPAWLSNGESVIAAAPTAMFAPLLSALNQLGGGAPVIVNSPQQSVGEDFLASAVAKGMMLAPRPVVSVEEINQVNDRVRVIENLGEI